MAEFLVKWKIWLLAAIILMVAGIFAFRPAKNSYRYHKEQHSLTMATNFFAKADYRNAALSARQVLQLNPTNVFACRVMANIADISKSPAALDMHRLLAEVEPTTENKLRFAEAGLRYQSSPYPVTSQILKELATSTATNLAFFHVIAAEYALAFRQLDAAEIHMSKAAALEPTNRLYQLNVAIIGLHNTNAMALDNARAGLQSFLADTNYSAAALRALLTDRLAHEDIVAARGFSEQLLLTPQATLPDRLQNLSILKKIAPADFTNQLVALQSQSATNAASVAQVGRWLNGNDLAVEVIRWFNSLSKDLRAVSAIRIVQASALDITGDWTALREFCAHGNWKESEFVRLALLAHAWGKLGDLSVFRGNWHAAVDAAGGNFGALANLLDMTTRWQLVRERQDLLWTMLKKFPRERWIVAALEEQYYRAGDTAGLNRVYRQMFSVTPESLEFKNNLAYTSLLLHTNLPEAQKQAAQLYEKTPDNPAIASTQAFALHLQGKNDEALVALKKLKPAFLERPSLALHYGLLLAATGDPAGAEHYLGLARAVSGLLPEEKRLLEGH